MKSLLFNLSQYSWTDKRIFVFHQCIIFTIQTPWLTQMQTKLFTIELSHNNDVIMGAIASQITSLTIIYSTVYSGADQRKHQRSASLAFVREIHRSPVNSPHKWPVTQTMFPFDDVIMDVHIFHPSLMTPMWVWLHYITNHEEKNPLQIKCGFLAWQIPLKHN